MKLNINGKELEVSDEELSKALEEKKESFDLKSDFVLRTEDEETSFKENLRKEGISTGAEIGRKEVIKGLGIEGEGLHKSDELSIEAIKGLMTSNTDAALKDANIAPDKKVAELQSDLGTLQKTIANQQSTIEEKDPMFATFKRQAKTDSEFDKHIPENIALPRKDVVTLMKANIKLDVGEDGSVFGVGMDGQPMKDKLLNPLPIKEVMGNFFNTNPHLLKGAQGGAGEGDSGGGSGKQSLEAFTKEMNEAGHATNGSQFVSVMQERMKAGTLDI